tara:strand:+ start:311 stop:487 length:177 start_codon:yes stop_codon:yes gene_type:complete
MANLGSAEIKIKLIVGNEQDNRITVYHGSCNSILESFKAKKGDWEKIWETIRSLKGDE